jgi:hypothetical protein
MQDLKTIIRHQAKFTQEEVLLALECFYHEYALGEIREKVYAGKTSSFDIEYALIWYFDLAPRDGEDKEGRPQKVYDDAEWDGCLSEMGPDSTGDLWWTVEVPILEEEIKALHNLCPARKEN